MKKIVSNRLRKKSKKNCKQENQSKSIERRAKVLKVNHPSKTIGATVKIKKMKLELRGSLIPILSRNNRSHHIFYF